MRLIASLFLFFFFQVFLAFAIVPPSADPSSVNLLPVMQYFEDTLNSRLTFSSLSSASGSLMFVKSAGASAGLRIVAGKGGYFGTTSNHPFSLITSGVKRLTILPNGNVGIGTSTPSVALEVSGDVGLAESGNLYIRGVKQYFPFTYSTNTRSIILEVPSNTFGVGTSSFSTATQQFVIGGGANISDTLYAGGFVRYAGTLTLSEAHTYGQGRVPESFLVDSAGECVKGSVKMSRSKVVTAWDGAAAACPKNWWVCEASERDTNGTGAGYGPCGTGAVTTNILRCNLGASRIQTGASDGLTLYESRTAANGGGYAWVLDSVNQISGGAGYNTGSGAYRRGVLINESGTRVANTDFAGELCNYRPVWCCGL